MKRVIFLDFDNVLNDDDTKDWIKPGPGLFFEGHTGLDTDKVLRLNQLVTSDDTTRFVFSTSWRKYYSDEELLEVLRKRGFCGKVHEKLPRTRARFSYTSRESQIEEWLEEAAVGEFFPESFVVLDDLSTKYIDLDRHVQTYGDEGGFNDRCLQEALRILARPGTPENIGIRVFSHSPPDSDVR